MASSTSCAVADIVDRASTQHGLSRRIAMTFPHFCLVQQIPRNIDMTTVVPSTSKERVMFAGEVVMSDPPATTAIRHPWQ